SVSRFQALLYPNFGISRDDCPISKVYKRVIHIDNHPDIIASLQYGNHKAVDNLSLTVQKGEIFALLGPNGAGKSTTLKMLTGLLKPKNGHILLDGQDIWVQGGESVRKQIGYVPDQPILYFRLTCKRTPLL
ncbi:MAG: ATP-binding cassette domain-containing protein, partial [Syntrophomonas sp.]|nr:ATP-binding cassette domain-containing protein [Syntrophomonas sp.]